MKTNASIKTIVAAVQKVSSELYGGNLVLGKQPEPLSKYVNRFTLRTKDKTKAPSILNKDNKALPRASWEAHEAVIREIFKTQPQSDMYVDPNSPEHPRFYIHERDVDPNYVSPDVILKEQEKIKEKEEKKKTTSKAKKLKMPELDQKSIKALIKHLQRQLHTGKGKQLA